MRNSMENYSDILVDLTLIRHGEVQANVEKRYISSTDMELTDNGIECLNNMYRSQHYNMPDYLFCSPMLRCRQTCDILFPDKEYQIIDELRETDFGQFEMKNYNELKDNKYYQSWIDSNGTLPFPQGEDRNAFIRRCMCGLDKIMSIIAVAENKELYDKTVPDTDKKIPYKRFFYKNISGTNNKYMNCTNMKTISAVAIVHGGNIMAIMSQLNNDEYYNYQCKNGEGYQCRLLLSIPLHILQN